MLKDLLYLDDEVDLIAGWLVAKMKESNIMVCVCLMYICT